MKSEVNQSTAVLLTAVSQYISPHPVREHTQQRNSLQGGVVRTMDVDAGLLLMVYCSSARCCNNVETSHSSSLPKPFDLLSVTSTSFTAPETHSTHSSKHTNQGAPRETPPPSSGSLSCIRIKDDLHPGLLPSPLRVLAVHGVLVAGGRTTTTTTSAALQQQGQRSRERH